MTDQPECPFKDDSAEWWTFHTRVSEVLEVGGDPTSEQALAWIFRPPLDRKTKRNYSNRIINPEGPCSVYRVYDSEGTLLYVGITARGVWRARQHAYRSEWWTLMARQEWEHFGSREEALAREAMLLLEHHPPYNVAIPKERA